MEVGVPAGARCSLCVLLSLCLLSFTVTSADASWTDGGLTEAQSDSAGVIHVAGWAAWEGCEKSVADESHPWLYDFSSFPEGTFWIGDTCSWQPFLTIGPGTGSTDCMTPERDLLDEPGLGIAVLWEGAPAWTQEETKQAFDLDAVRADGASGQLLCLAAMYMPPELCDIGLVDAVCEPGVEELILLAAEVVREPSPPSTEVVREPSPSYGVSSPAAAPVRCRAKRASPKKKACKKRRHRPKSFVRGKDIPVPRG
jgi:hypothetical protein